MYMHKYAFCNACVLISACVPTCTDLWACLFEDVWVFWCMWVRRCILQLVRVDFCAHSAFASISVCVPACLDICLWICGCVGERVCVGIWVCWVCWYCECMNVYVCVYMKITRRVVFLLGPLLQDGVFVCLFGCACVYMCVCVYAFECLCTCGCL